MVVKANMKQNKSELTANYVHQIGFRSMLG